MLISAHHHNETGATRRIYQTDGSNVSESTSSMTFIVSLLSSFGGPAFFGQCLTRILLCPENKLWICDLLSDAK